MQSRGKGDVSRKARIHRNARIEAGGVVLVLGRELQKQKRAFSRDKKWETKNKRKELA
jgi:hypothetical protein